MSKKILWASLYSLHDTSSGAAISSRTQLEELVKQGFTVKVLTAFVFDNPRGTSMFPDLDEKLNSERRIFTVSADGIEYVYVKTASRYVNEVTVAEENFFLQVYFDMLRRFQPDIMMGYGGEPLSFIMRREAKARGISVVYNLCNGSHQNFRFPDVDLIITKSRATVDYYARWGNAVRNTGVFIRPESVRALKREPKYITFINPTPEKGTALFARLAMMSGVFEMVARIAASLWLVPALGFKGVCLGDPMAWMAACLFLIPAMSWILHRLMHPASPSRHGHRIPVGQH